MKVYEFAIDYGMRSEFVEVLAKDARAARDILWLSMEDEQKNNCACLDQIEEREATSDDLRHGSVPRYLERIGGNPR